ncbi:MAG: DNA repair protein RecO [Clostridia bacterium]|nr:DNA repair protein RecO [Clostridia bacterium]
MKEIYGIICQANDYKENDKLLNVFTPLGMLQLVARGVKSKKSKLKNLINVFTFANFQYVEGHRNILNGLDIYDSFFDAWSDIKKNACISFCLELTTKCFYKDKETQKEFVELIKVIKSITYDDTLEIGFVLKYLIFCLESLGIDYEFLKDQETEYEALVAFSNADIEEIGTLPFFPNVIKKLISTLVLVLRNELGISIVSLEMLLKI